MAKSNKKSSGSKEAMPSGISPMLATLVKEVPSSDDYIYEVKWDGYRIICYSRRGSVRLNSRNNLDYTSKYPLVTEAVAGLGHDLILDGEMVVFNEEGKPDFNLIQNYNGQVSPITYYVFDLLWLDGQNLMDRPLTERKEILSDLLEGKDILKVSEHFDDGEGLYEQMLQLDMEGIVAKRADSPYLPGNRGSSWLKVPTRRRQEFVIGGWAESERGRSFRSLLFGAYESGRLKWVGRSGGGYKEKEMPAILNRLKKLEIPDSPFENKVLDTKGAKIHWVKPELVANFEFAAFTNTGRIRKPATFLGFRKDKDAKQVVLEIPKESAKAAREGKKGASSKPSRVRRDQVNNHKPVYLNEDSNWKKVDEAIRGKPVTEYPMDNCVVRLHDAEHEIWEGIRKGDLVLYYHKIARFILPYLKDRPQSLNLKLTTAGGSTTFIKDMENRQPECAEIFTDLRRVKKKGKRSQIDYLVCNNVETLLYMVDYGCVDINPWASRRESPDNPDFIWIDLDPTVVKGDAGSEDKGFSMAVETALAAKQVLSEYKIKTFVKTSGKTGLHIYIPCHGFTFRETRKIANNISDEIHRLVPDITTRSESISGRGDKVYIDANQNDYADTLAAPYSIRPYHKPLVSTPLDWKEVNQGLDRYAFDLSTIFKRLERKVILFSESLSPITGSRNSKILKRFF